MNDGNDLKRSGFDSLGSPEDRNRGKGAAVGGGVGGVIGSMIGGPVGAAVGGAIGAAIGVCIVEKDSKEKGEEEK